MTERKVWRITVALLVAAAWAWGTASVAEGSGQALSAAASTKGTVVSLASAKVDKRWVPSGFDGMPEGDYSPNACESSLAEGLRAAGFAEPRPSLTDAVRAKARELRTVFRRYNDVSSIPNDFAVRMAAVVDPAATALVACGIAVSADRKGAGEPLFHACAQAHCKAVGMRDRQRAATASGARCVDHADRAAGGDEAMRLLCAEMGAQLGGKLSAR
jgi:hypothetical protein